MLKRVPVYIVFLCSFFNIVFAQVTSSEALQKLIDGNKRFVSGQLENPGRSMERVHEIYNEQHPFAIILSCSDSRVPPEVIFDEGLGDLFVIRVAGNVADEV
ncbi:MAG: carbonic anhydrase, partial [Ignavibacteriaceae bacterium]